MAEGEPGEEAARPSLRVLRRGWGWRTGTWLWGAGGGGGCSEPHAVTLRFVPPQRPAAVPGGGGEHHQVGLHRRPGGLGVRRRARLPAGAESLHRAQPGRALPEPGRCRGTAPTAPRPDPGWPCSGGGPGLASYKALLSGCPQSCRLACVCAPLPSTYTTVTGKEKLFSFLTSTILLYTNIHNMNIFICR